jgi:hypothetical protein
MISEDTDENTNAIAKSPSQFAHDIEELVWEKDISYIEAICLYCETNGLEIETASDLVRKNDLLKSHIEEEAEGLNYLEKKARLPV